MSDIITTLHPENDDNTNLYPNIKKDNIPYGSIDMGKLGDDVKSLLNSINELHPSGVDTSTNILAFTTNKGIYIGSDTGHWYYWNGTQYVDGGVYQTALNYNEIESNLYQLIFNKTFNATLGVQITLNYNIKIHNRFKIINNTSNTLYIRVRDENDNTDKESFSVGSNITRIIETSVTGDLFNFYPLGSGEFKIEDLSLRVNVLEDDNEIVNNVLFSNSQTSYPSTITESDYPYPLSKVRYVSSVKIEKGKILKQIRYYTNSPSSVAGLFLLNSSNKVVYLKYINEVSGENIFDIDFYCDEDVYFGFANSAILYAQGVSDDKIFSISGLNIVDGTLALGNTMTIIHQYAGTFGLALQWIIEDADIVKQCINNKKEIDKLNKVYNHNAIVSFIDDDTGQYVPEIWGYIIEQTDIRMGFACITGFMSGEVTPPNNAYIQMPLTYLQDLYNNGNEVYSHSYSHISFYSDEHTPEMIQVQCQKSRDWLNANGFTRNSNIIVYPGGLGENQIEKQNVVRRNYQYGVDTVGGGLNDFPVNNPQCIYRFNADTATLDELKAKVDEAISGNKLLVFMCHAYELNIDKVNQINKLITLINYIKDEGADILPLDEAIHQVCGW